MQIQITKKKKNKFIVVTHLHTICTADKYKKGSIVTCRTAKNGNEVRSTIHLCYNPLYPNTLLTAFAFYLFV